MSKLEEKGKFIFGKNNNPIDCFLIQLEAWVDVINSTPINGTVVGVITVHFLFNEIKNMDIIVAAKTNDFLEIQLDLETGTRKFQCLKAFCAKVEVNSSESCKLFFECFHYNTEGIVEKNID